MLVRPIVNEGTEWYRYSASPAPNRLPIAGSSLRSRGSPNSASISEMWSGCWNSDVDRKSEPTHTKASFAT